ncbi:MAG: hypothetical protein IPG45_01665 [Deltaproteobacteria bacterium]|nr:hypothetical protein [Deltaproteobacteria bacterium]
MKTTPVLLGVVLFAACGEATKTVRVVLEAPTLAAVDPGAIEARLAKVRVFVRDTGEGVIVRDLAPSERQVTVENYQTEETTVDVVVEGYDELGTVVAYGRVEDVNVEEEEATVNVPFRRSLAYVIHQPNPGQQRPDSAIYVLDLATRAFVGKVTIPGTAPSARGISAWGGQAMLVTFSDEGMGKVGVLSTSDHTWQVHNLPQIQDLAIAGSTSNTGLVAGGGRLNLIDLSSGAVETLAEGGGPLVIGGRVRDAAIGLGGRRAVVALDTNLAIVDLPNKATRAVVLDSPGGVGLSADGITAFATSRTLPVAVEIALEQQTTDVRGAAFAGPTGIATYSDAIPGVLAVYTDEQNGASRVLGWEDGGSKLPDDQQVTTLRSATGITSDGPGRRVVVVAAGTSSTTAGLTVIDTFSNQQPLQSSTALYPTDPDDNSAGDPLVSGTRYRPRGVAVIYGR